MPETFPPSTSAERTVYALVRYPWDRRDEPIPTDIDSPLWRPWIRCKPADIESGMIASMVAHRAFREQGGPKMFNGPDHVDDFTVSVVIFDPATHRMKDGRILSAHSTTFSFTPR